MMLNLSFWSQASSTESLDTVGTASIEPRNRSSRNSLSILCRRFLMVLLCSPNQNRVSLDVASTVLIKDPYTDGFEPPSRSRCRRLYDIANVLVAMGIIKKVHYLFGTKKIPLFVYCGPKPEDGVKLSRSRSEQFDISPAPNVRKPVPLKKHNSLMDICEVASIEREKILHSKHTMNQENAENIAPLKKRPSVRVVVSPKKHANSILRMQLTNENQPPLKLSPKCSPKTKSYTVRIGNTLHVQDMGPKLIKPQPLRAENSQEKNKMLIISPNSYLQQPFRVAPNVSSSIMISSAGFLPPLASAASQLLHSAQAQKRYLSAVYETGGGSGNILSPQNYLGTLPKAPRMSYSIKLPGTSISNSYPSKEPVTLLLPTSN